MVKCEKGDLGDLEAVTAVLLKVQVFWSIVPCS